MSVDAQNVTANSNHAGVQNLRGWSLRGAFVARLRVAAITGQILGTIENNSHELFVDVINAPGGTYVEVVSGAITEGVLFYD